MDHLTELLVSAQRGDRDSLERFVALTHSDVLSLCRYLGDTDNAEDLAQLTYERAIKSMHRFRADGTAKSWLFTIARRTCADGTRRRIRRRRLREKIIHQPVENMNHTTDVGAITELDELLLALDDDRRSAFVLTQINGLRYAEAAELLAVPIGTIRSRVSRAREQLIAAVEAAESDPATELSGSDERQVN